MASRKRPVSRSIKQDAQHAFKEASEQAKRALFNEEDAFAPWEAATDGYDNAVPDMLGERTGGQDSTRITYAQYFFDRNTEVGNMYVSFRATNRRANGNEYVYTDVPVYAAKRFYNALSKGKNINGAIGGLEQYGYMPVAGDPHFGKQEPTDYGLAIQTGRGRTAPESQLSLFDEEGEETESPRSSTWYGQQLSLFADEDYRNP